MGIYHRLADRAARTQLGGWWFLHMSTRLDRRLMRWSGGRFNSGIGTDFGEHCALLVCTGARTGKKREIPLLASPFGDGWVLVASAVGQDTHPAWYHNLIAEPRCDLLTRGRGRVHCVAREACGTERESAWQAANAQYSGYTVYQARTARTLPIFVLTPVS